MLRKLKNLRAFIKNPILYFDKKYSECDKIISIDLPISNFFLIKDREYIKKILLESNKTYIKGSSLAPLKFFLGNGILTSEGQLWKKNRKLIQPAFSKKSIDYFIEVMFQNASEMVTHWNGLRAKDTPIDISSEFFKVTAEIATKSLFSTSVGKDIKRMEKSVNVLSTAVHHNIIMNPFTYFIKANRERKVINDIFEKIIDDRKKDPNSDNYIDLLSTLLHTTYADNGMYMEMSQVKSEVKTIFGAGHETSANSLKWTFILLHKNKDKKIKLIKELRKLTSDEVNDFSKINEITYLDNIISESLRLFPTAWLIGRKATKTHRLGKFNMKKNHQVLIPLYSLHRDENVWEKPNEFIPERFQDKNYSKYDYIPFGGGPRMCIGSHFTYLELKILLAKIFYHFDFDFISEVSYEFMPLITMRPVSDLKIKLYKNE